MAYDMYQELILQHYRAPRNFGTIPDPSASGEESNPLCGDHIRMDLKLDGARTRVEDVKFSGDGCAISMASASLLTGKVLGHSITEVEKITREDVFNLLGIPLSPVRVKCALTGFVALGRALHGGAPGAGAVAEPAPSAAAGAP